MYFPENRFTIPTKRTLNVIGMTCTLDETFANTLQRVGAQVKLILYKGKTHTDLFLQDPLRGGKDRVLEDMLSVIQPSDMEHRAKEILAPPIKRLVPEIMLQAARKVSPF